MPWSYEMPKDTSESVPRHAKLSLQQKRIPELIKIFPFKPSLWNQGNKIVGTGCWNLLVDDKASPHIFPSYLHKIVPKRNMRMISRFDWFGSLEKYKEESTSSRSEIHVVVFCFAIASIILEDSGDCYSTGEVGGGSTSTLVVWVSLKLKLWTIPLYGIQRSLAPTLSSFVLSDRREEKKIFFPAVRAKVAPNYTCYHQTWPNQENLRFFLIHSLWLAGRQEENIFLALALYKSLTPLVPPNPFVLFSLLSSTHTTLLSFNNLVRFFLFFVFSNSQV